MDRFIVKVKVWSTIRDDSYNVEYTGQIYDSAADAYGEQKEAKENGYDAWIENLDD